MLSRRLLNAVSTLKEYYHQYENDDQPPPMNEFRLVARAFSTPAIFQRLLASMRSEHPRFPMSLFLPGDSPFSFETLLDKAVILFGELTEQERFLTSPLKMFWTMLGDGLEDDQLKHPLVRWESVFEPFKVFVEELLPLFDSGRLSGKDLEEALEEGDSSEGLGDFAKELRSNLVLRLFAERMFVDFEPRGGGSTTLEMLSYAFQMLRDIVEECSLCPWIEVVVTGDEHSFEPSRDFGARVRYGSKAARAMARYNGGDREVTHATRHASRFVELTMGEDEEEGEITPGSAVALQTRGDQFGSFVLTWSLINDRRLVLVVRQANETNARLLHRPIPSMPWRQEARSHTTMRRFTQSLFHLETMLTYEMFSPSGTLFNANLFAAAHPLVDVACSTNALDAFFRHFMKEMPLLLLQELTGDSGASAFCYEVVNTQGGHLREIRVNVTNERIPPSSRRKTAMQFGMKRSREELEQQDEELIAAVLSGMDIDDDDDADEPIHSPSAVPSTSSPGPSTSSSAPPPSTSSSPQPSTSRAAGEEQPPPKRPRFVLGPERKKTMELLQQVFDVPELFHKIVVELRETDLPSLFERKRLIEHYEIARTLYIALGKEKRKQTSPLQIFWMMLGLGGPRHSRHPIVNWEALFEPARVYIDDFFYVFRKVKGGSKLRGLQVKLGKNIPLGKEHLLPKPFRDIPVSVQKATQSGELSVRDSFPSSFLRVRRLLLHSAHFRFLVRDALRLYEQKGESFLEPHSTLEHGFKIVQFVNYLRTNSPGFHIMCMLDPAEAARDAAKKQEYLSQMGELSAEIEKARRKFVIYQDETRLNELYEKKDSLSAAEKEREARVGSVPGFSAEFKFFITSFAAHGNQLGKQHPLRVAYDLLDEELLKGRANQRAAVLALSDFVEYGLKPLPPGVTGPQQLILKKGRERQQTIVLAAPPNFATNTEQQNNNALFASLTPLLSGNVLMHALRQNPQLQQTLGRVYLDDIHGPIEMRKVFDIAFANGSHGTLNYDDVFSQQQLGAGHSEFVERPVTLMCHDSQLDSLLVRIARDMKKASKYPHWLEEKPPQLLPEAQDNVIVIRGLSLWKTAREQHIQVLKNSIVDVHTGNPRDLLKIDPQFTKYFRDV